MELQTLIQSEIQKYLGKSQFTVGSVQTHAHTGQDSNRVSAQNLNFANFAIWGQVGLSGGSATISNNNIVPTSTILVTPTGTQTIAVGDKILSGSCTTGIATIIGTGSLTVNYLIIF